MHETKHTFGYAVASPVSDGIKFTNLTAYISINLVVQESHDQLAQLITELHRLTGSC